MNDKFIRSLQIDWNKISENSYLHGIPSLRQISFLEFPENITIFVGENGSGKSTLLEAIAVAYGFNPEGGTLNYRFSTFDDVSELNQGITLTKGYRRAASNYFFRAESFFNVASKTEEYRGYTPKRSTTPAMGENPSMSNPMGKAFCPISSPLKIRGYT